VTVSTGPPRATSARNAWAATVTGLTLLADRVRLSLDGRPPAAAGVTTAAVSELGLAPGTPVRAAVKATDLEVYAPG
jgi:molybdate transport system ATP-binding protein